MSLQAAFGAALLDPTAAPPAALCSWNGSDPGQRLAVYRNNVTLSLIDALAATFPVVRAMVGEAFFTDLARAYLRAHPPRSPLLSEYGVEFPVVLESCAALAALPYLPDLARLELARRVAYHAADAAPLAPEAFAALEESALPGLRVRLHPSVCVLASPHAMVSLWAAHQGILEIERVCPEVPEEALVLRPHFEVHVVTLPPGGATFLSALGAGACMAEATMAAASTPGFSLPDAMSALVTQGAAIALLSP